MTCEEHDGDKATFGQGMADIWEQVGETAHYAMVERLVFGLVNCGAPLNTHIPEVFISDNTKLK